MKPIRRLCALLLAVLLMLTAAGCSSEPSSNMPDTPSESSSSLPEEAPSEPEESSSEAEEPPSEAEPGSVPEAPADPGQLVPGSPAHSHLPGRDGPGGRCAGL